MESDKEKYNGSDHEDAELLQRWDSTDGFMFLSIWFRCASRFHSETLHTLSEFVTSLLRKIVSQQLSQVNGWRADWYALRGLSNELGLINGRHLHELSSDDRKTQEK